MYDYVNLIQNFVPPMKKNDVNFHDNLPKLVIMILEIKFQQFYHHSIMAIVFGAIEW
jgi:hypothetical protein